MKQSNQFNYIITGSLFLQRLAQLRTRSVSRQRVLTASEIAQLERQGNVCSNWTQLRVAAEFDPAAVHQNYFEGRVVLGSFQHRQSGTGGGSGSAVRLPGAGVFASTLIDCEIGDNAVIHRCPLLSGYVIGTAAYISASSLVFRGSAGFGNGTQISAGIESGGREIELLADLDMPTVVEVLGNLSDRTTQSGYRDVARRYSAACSAGFGCVDTGAHIENSRSIENSWIGAGARISGADLISDTTVLSSREEPTLVGPGTIVEHAAVQHGARVDSQSIVQRSLIMEYATVERQAKVIQSIVGPNAVLGEGEVNASCVGPFTGAHHQSLLIAAFWPAGGGVLGAGANVGSNHTSRVPDQEIWPGEGMFFGLDSVIKFPANYREAPYSVIAAGVTTLPQRVSFPFSLIVPPQEQIEGVSPAINRLIPAWGLRHNLYALLRNQSKYRRRNRARRHQFDFSFLREEIVAMMQDAVRRLESVDPPDRFYLPGRIEGIGKNLLLESDRIEAIETYRYFIEYAQYTQLKNRMYQRLVLDRSPASAQENAHREQLHKLRSMIDELQQSARLSRGRDLDRGTRIIVDYAQTHPDLQDDDILQESDGQAERDQGEIDELLRYLDSTV